MGKSKKVKLKQAQPKFEKTPRVFPNAKNETDSILAHNPVWQVQKIDFDHNEWGWGNITREDFFEEVIKKLSDYETMLWGEIFQDKTRDHSIPFTKLSSEAQKRLRSLKMDDVDDVYRLRLTGKKRVYGILDRYIFKILWWDPQHTVCVSVKKHT